MRRCLAFARRNWMECIRDPLSVIFGVGFPVVILLLITMLKRSIPDMPDSSFPITTFAPAMAVFGLSFLSLFLGQLIASDRDTSFLMRVFASPMTGTEYILGYTLPMLPLAMIQCVLVLGVGVAVGLPFGWGLVRALLLLLPVALLFISLGLLIGSVFTSKQAPGISSILVNVVAWLSGTWFDLNLIGGAFRTICYLLPFSHALDMVVAAMTGDWAGIFPHLFVVLGYTVAFAAAAVALFMRRMKGK